MFKRVGGKMKINYVIVDVYRKGVDPSSLFTPTDCVVCSVPMGNSNSARRNQARSVPTSPEVRLRFRLKSPYYIIITMDNSRRFDMRYFL